jgi:hypothetical protein
MVLFQVPVSIWERKYISNTIHNQHNAFTRQSPERIIEVSKCWGKKAEICKAKS